MVNAVHNDFLTLISKLTPSTVGFFLILHLHSAVSAKTVHCRRFRKNVLPYKPLLVLASISSLFLVVFHNHAICKAYDP